MSCLKYGAVQRAVQYQVTKGPWLLHSASTCPLSFDDDAYKAVQGVSNLYTQLTIPGNATTLSVLLQNLKVLAAESLYSCVCAPASVHGFALHLSSH